MNAHNILSGMVACLWLLEGRKHEMVGCVTGLSSGLCFPLLLGVSNFLGHYLPLWCRCTLTLSRYVSYLLFCKSKERGGPNWPNSSDCSSPINHHCGLLSACHRSDLEAATSHSCIYCGLILILGYGWFILGVFFRSDLIWFLSFKDSLKTSSLVMAFLVFWGYYSIIL